MTQHPCARQMLLALLLVALAAHFGGCEGEPQSSPSGRSDVVIGLITPLTGEVQDLGMEMLSSAQLAAARASHEYPGYRFEITARDDENSGVAASRAAAELASSKSTIAIVAAGTSAAAKMQMATVEGKGIAVVTSTATASDLTEGDVGFVFRVIPPNRCQSRALAVFARDVLDAKRASVVFQQEDYSKDLKDNFRTTFEASGGQIVSELGFESEESDFRALLGQVRASESDVILCAAQHVPVARVLLRAKEAGIARPILSGETAFTDKLLETAGHAAEGFYVTGPAFDLDLPSPRLEAFLNEYEGKEGKRPGIYGCYTYDAIGLIAETVASEGVSTRQDLIGALSNVAAYKGVTGTITFDEAGDVDRQYGIYTVKNSEFVLAE